MKGFNGPVLELDAATPSFDESGLPPVPFTMRLMPGECAIVESRDVPRATMFADLCTGMVPLQSGSVRFMGLDWTTLQDRQLNALRGRIGRTTRRASWSDLFGTHVEMMLKPLHHTNRPLEDILAEMVRLGERFGLPGVPVDAPSRLSHADMSRASCVRAFLGTPQLLLLEDPLEQSSADITQPFLECVTEERNRGTAVIWLVRNPAVWQPYRMAVSTQWRLMDHGLMAVRRS